jgi:hypothetical protein
VRTALITGGSGGIGLALAREFRKHDWSVVLVARSEERLQAAASELGATYIVSDLGRPGAAEALKDETDRQGLAIDALVNNAGYGAYGDFISAPLAEQEGMIHLNVLALTTLTRLYLPAMVERKRGQVLNVASTAAFFPGPLMAVYYATKAYVLSFSEATANELQGTGVTVTCLCPGATETDFATRADMADSKLFRAGMTSAEEVARVGYDAMVAGKGVVVVGRQNRVATFFGRLLPTAAAARVARKVQERA